MSLKRAFIDHLSGSSYFLARDDNEKTFCSYIIMTHRSGIDFSVHEELKEVPLLGGVINLPVRELLLIFFDIEKVFDFKIPEEDVLNNGFATYNSILNIIQKNMNNRKTDTLCNKCFS